MAFEGNIKVQSFDGIFFDFDSCNKVAVATEERLMSTRPSPQSEANTYCFQIPESA
jgi:hypothetical protein